MSHGLQALVSYSLAKSSDQGSADQGEAPALSVSQIVLPPLSPSDFHIRNSLAGAVSYEVPAPPWGRVADAILGGWAVDGLLRLSSGPPLNVIVQEYSLPTTNYQTTPNVGVELPPRRFILLKFC